jgi:glycosyltransferase involved in cell wall biosynthesis
MNSVESEEESRRCSALVLIAALNEEEGIGPTLAELSEVLEDPRFLVVDGNSTDRTVEVAKEMGADVMFQEGRGKGDAVAHAIGKIDADVKYVVIVDADFTYPAGYLPEMIRILEENPDVGMVCGNRFNARFHLEWMGNLYYLGNRVLAFAHNLFNGVEMRDPLTGLRVVRLEVLKGWRPKSRGFDLEVEMNHRVEKKGFQIKEVPIHYRARLGEKKLKLTNGFAILRRILRESFL